MFPASGWHQLIERVMDSAFATFAYREAGAREAAGNEGREREREAAAAAGGETG